MELFPDRLKKLWNGWELRTLIVLSLFLQIILIFFGDCRKNSSRSWIRIVLWSAYLMADWVATVCLGVISNDLGDVVDSASQGGSLDAHTELTAFWAPFLLLHLGGPDTISAYSMEDNELWLRHLLGLGVQAGVAVYIILMAWTGSRMSVLSIPMLLAGLIKYGERTWVLRSASSEQFRDSMLTPPDPGPNYSKFMEEYTLKQFEGFHVVADEVIEAQLPVGVSSTQNNLIPDVDELLKAYDLFQTFKRLFVDLILSFHDRDISQSLFKDMPFNKGFKVIEIELGFMYDVMYTKAPVTYSIQGCCFRFISFSSTCMVLLIFSLGDLHKYPKVDLALTFVLLAVAILLEIYAIILLISSDWCDLYLSTHTRPYIRQAVARLQLPKHLRWSNSMAQYNVLSFCLKDRPVICSTVQKIFGLDELLEKFHYTTYKEVSVDLKRLIFNHLKEKFELLQESSSSEMDLRTLCTCRGGRVLAKNNYGDQLDWSTKIQFDQSILIWHIATDLCYYADHGEKLETIISYRKMSKRLSHYLLFLLVMYPFMLPIGIGMIRFRDTCAEATKFFEERKRVSNKIEASEMLLKVNVVVPPTKVKGDRSKSVLFDACRLASQMQKISNKEAKWSLISNVWVEMLSYAASQCRGNYHAQQLRRGGELLTHVWLLMAHFGITEQFQISQGHARAKMVVR